MPIDPNVALGVKPVQIANPLEQYMQVQQIQQAQNQSRLADLMYGEKQQQIARAQNLRNIANSWDANTTDEQRRDSLRNNGYFTEADQLDTALQNRAKTKAEAQKNQAEAQAKQIETAGKQLDMAGQAFGYVRSNPTRENAYAALDYLATNGVYSPEQVAQLKGMVDANPANIQGLADQAFRASLAAKDQLPKIDTRNLGGTTETFSVEPVTGAVKVLNTAKNTVSPDAALQANTTQRGQDMTDARAREQIAAGKVPSGYRQGPDGTLVAIPGGPADSNNKPLTEDQAKSTGWLVQAENAWKNMQAVALDKAGKFTSAVRPGRVETIASSIPFGLGEPAANTARSTDRQKFLQGASSLSEALLRAATGAGVNKDEAVQKVREITPVWGDDDATIKQKLDSIPLYIESLKVRSGPGATKAAGVLDAPAPNVPPDIAALLKKHGGQ